MFFELDNSYVLYQTVKAGLIGRLKYSGFGTIVTCGMTLCVNCINDTLGSKEISVSPYYGKYT